MGSEEWDRQGHPAEGVVSAGALVLVTSSLTSFPEPRKDSLPSIRSELKEVKIKSPIEQIMLGNAGLYRQQNMEKRKTMSVREWAELCGKEEYRAPAVHEVTVEGRRIHTAVPQHRASRPRKKKEEQSTKEESAVPSPPGSDKAASPPAQPVPGPSKPKGRRAQQPKEVRDAIRDAKLAENAAKDDQFLEGFDWDNDWLPHNTLASDYTPEWCQTLERHYWKNCSLGKSPWYGADTQGTLFTDETKAWNVGHLPSALDRLLPSSNKGLPGVNMPYLYFGMWRATFAWHVEDMDLYSINYIHFGAPKFWYAVPQNKAQALEHAMRTYFPKDTSQCHQFLRHKSFLASPTILANSSCRPNHLVQHAGEFVITYPRGYHAGFNLGLNCAESVNFALECWIEVGRNAKICECVSDRYASVISNRWLSLTAPQCAHRCRSASQGPSRGEGSRGKRRRFRHLSQTQTGVQEKACRRGRASEERGGRPDHPSHPDILEKAEGGRRRG